MTLYTILGIPSDADQDAIRSSYKTLARRYHPDAGAGSSTEKFRNVVEAYETLSDPHRRAIYDRSLRPAPTPVPVRVHPLRMRPEPLIPRRPLFYRRYEIEDLFEEL